jgi:hypothetical protein
MATYSNNTTIKFQGGVSLSGNSSYSVPAGHYAVIGNASAGANNAGEYGRVLIGGRQILGTGVLNYADQNMGSNIHVPEGVTISTQTNGKSGFAFAIITVFKNSP